jgi:hypothetical protein
MRRYLIYLMTFMGVKVKVKELYLVLKWYYFNFFTKIGISQTINYKSIPIIIISFNQLYYLKQLIDFLKSHKYKNIVIIDNNSTYKPLLDYFDSIESSVILHRLNQNLGHLVFWKSKELFDMYSKGYYIVTDADIVPVKKCPEDFVLHFKKILDKNFKVTKVGFSLKIDDLPDSNLNKQKVIDWEQQFWTTKITGNNFSAYLDTTFAIYRPNYNYNEKNFFTAIRTKEPYQSRHGGWYLDNKNLTEEQLFYFANCNESSSWRINESGEIQNKKLYN